VEAARADQAGDLDRDTRATDIRRHHRLLIGSQVIDRGKVEEVVDPALPGGRVVQRHVLYLGEINDSQELAWRKSVAVFEDGAPAPRTLSLFPEDRGEALLPDTSIVRLKLSELRLCRPRQWGACWLVMTLWRDLQLDRFWAERLPASRKGTRWDEILLVLPAYRLLAPGSEWRLHRHWFEQMALADLLGGDFGLAEIHKLYACHDRAECPISTHPGPQADRQKATHPRREPLGPVCLLRRRGPARL